MTQVNETGLDQRQWQWRKTEQVNKNTAMRRRHGRESQQNALTGFSGLHAFARCKK